MATTTDQAWRSAFESLFLGAVRLARVLAADLGGQRQGGGVTGSSSGTGGSLVLVLASSVRVPLAELAISNGLFPGLAGVVKRCVPASPCASRCAGTASPRSSDVPLWRF